ncbi:MAG: hypothetical protein ACO293_07070 [Nitrosopumilaceae archaeon]
MTIKDKEKIMELIKRCKIFRFTTEETLSFLEENGHKISDRSLRRIKHEMESNTSQRLIKIIKHDKLDELFHSLDTHREIEKDYWKLLPQATTINEKIKIYDAIHKNRDKIEELTFAAPFMDEFFSIMRPILEKTRQLEQNC